MKWKKRLKEAWNARGVVGEAARFRPWDYGFVLALEKACFGNMIPYFGKHGHLVNSDMTVRDLKLAVRLIDIITGDDSAYEADFSNAKTCLSKLTKHVNARNRKRFVPYWPEKVSPAVLDGLRQQKAFHLYHKLRYYRMRKWWD